MNKVLLTMAALAMAISANANDYDKYVKKTFKSAADGGVLLYRQLSPETNGAAKKAKYPVVLFLHGAGERGADNEKQIAHVSGIFLNPANAEKFPAYVIFPQCPDNLTWAYDNAPSWTTMPEAMPADAPESTMMKLVIEFLKDFIATHPDADSSRIYVMGLSMGAIGTFDIAARHPEIFAAAVPMCGCVNPEKIKAAKSVNFSIYHGDKDNVVPVEGSRMAYKSLRAAGAKVRYTEFAGCGHGCWDPACNDKELLPWLFSQKKRK